MGMRATAKGALALASALHFLWLPAVAFEGHEGKSEGHYQGNSLSIPSSPNTEEVPLPSQRRRAPEVDEERGRQGSEDEGLSIKPIDIPFLQKPGGWEKGGAGISFDSTGEPKSGTTWTERVITELAVRLCGSPTNTWCKMGGLVVIPNDPDPSYEWEMLHADSGKLFSHFRGRTKHKLPGMGKCNPRGIQHHEYFELEYPCKKRNPPPSREQLQECLPNASDACASKLPSQDPDKRRMAVVFRDPRNVVISERRMRMEVYETHKIFPPLPEYIRRRFQTIVAWQFERWMWHTTYFKAASHVMFYEDLEGDPEALVDLAAFMGLNCPNEEAKVVWEKHRNANPHAGYESLGFPDEIYEHMNATMSALLPEAMLDRYGLKLSNR